MPNEHLKTRPLESAEFDRAVAMMEAAFLFPLQAERIECERLTFEFDRSLAVFDGDDIVATTAIYGRQLTVPGGPAPIAGVTAVSVAATHRRRGLLSRMMTEQLHDLHAAGREPVAVLWASEPGIYGRYGYGMATRQARLAGRTRELGLRPEISKAAGEISVAAPLDVVDDLAAVYDVVRQEQVGFPDRPENWWRSRFFDPGNERKGATPMAAAVHTGSTGPDAYAVYATKGDGTETGQPNGQLIVHELVATTPDALAAIWEFVAGLDLVRQLEWRQGQLDGPLTHMLADPRALAQISIDGLWVRLVDLDRAIASRRYAAPADVVVEVTDKRCPWNAGTWRLLIDADGTGTAERASEHDSAAAEVSLDIADLGAAYLGGVSLTTLAAAGRVTANRPAALRALSTAFSGHVTPYCPEVF